MGYDIPENHHESKPSPEYRFNMDITSLCAECHRIAELKGFHESKPTFGVHGADTRHILSWLMLITTEVAEAAEAVRKDDFENFGEELADICIRIFDTAQALDVNLEARILDKMQKNRKREVRHGGKLA